MRAELLIEVWLMTAICIGWTPAYAHVNVCVRED